MLSQRVAHACVVTVVWVVHVLAVCRGVGVPLHRVVGVVGEEQTVPCAMLLFFSVLRISERLVVSL